MNSKPHTVFSSPSKAGEDDVLGGLLAVLWGVAPFHVLRVAVEQGALDWIAGNEPADFTNLCAVMNWRERPARCLLSVLAAINLVEVDGETIKLTLAAKKLLLKRHGASIAGYFRRLKLMADAYARLEDLLENDTPDPMLDADTKSAFGLSQSGNPSIGNDFRCTLHATSTPVAEEFAKIISKYKLKTILDVGAGSGIFSVKVLDLYPESEVDFLDTPLVCKDAQASLVDKAERIHFLPINWNDWVPDKKYDGVFLHHVLHEEREYSAAHLFNKAANAVVAGGRLYVIGLFPDTETSLLTSNIFSLNLLLEIGSDNTTLKWVREQARSGGLQEESVHRLSGDRTLWIGRRSY